MKTGRMMTLGVALLVAAGQMMTLSGCGKEEPPPPPPPKRDPPPPPPPVRIEISPLMIGVDARVQFPAGKAPYDRNLAEAVISFATALATGDDATLGGMLGLRSREILDSMLADGSWFDETDEIEAVRVVYLGQEPDGADDANFAEFVLAVQQPGKAYTLGWSADDTDGGWVMSPMDTVDLVLPRAADWDGESMGDYQSERGWGAGPAGAGMAEMPGQDASLVAYLASQTVMNLMSAGGTPMDLDPAMVAQYASMANPAGAGGITPAQAMQMMEDGKRRAQAGERPGSAEVQALVQGLSMAAGAMGQSWDEAKILSAMAEVLGISESAMREIFEG